MKRIFLSMALVGALLVSCQSTATKANDEANDFKAKIEQCQNPDSIRYYVDQAVAYADSLSKSGKPEEAADYLNDIRNTVSAKAPDAVTYFDQARLSVDAAAAQAEAAAEAAKDSVDHAADRARDAVSNAADSVRNRASEAVSNAAERGREAVSNAANAAGNAASNAANNARNAVSGALSGNH